MTSLCSIIHVLGWLISVLAYTISLFIPYPEPYYQVANCTLDNTVVNNPDAPNAGMYYVAIMAVGVFGVGITDLASGDFPYVFTIEFLFRINSRLQFLLFLQSLHQI